MSEGEVISRSARLRELLGHPVIDGDGHIIVIIAAFLDYVRDHGHGDLLEAITQLRGDGGARQVQDAAAAIVTSGGPTPHSVPSRSLTGQQATFEHGKRRRRQRPLSGCTSDRRHGRSLVTV